MRNIDDKTLEKLRRDYPAGTRVVLKKMDDPYPIPVGTKGTIRYIDDIGDAHVDWDNHRGLALVIGVDEFDILDSVTVTCYGKTKVWDSRKEAADFYLSAILNSEGSENQRYTKIYINLMMGKKECSDAEE